MINYYFIIICLFSIWIQTFHTKERQNMQEIPHNMDLAFVTNSYFLSSPSHLADQFLSCFFLGFSIPLSTNLLCQSYFKPPI